MTTFVVDSSVLITWILQERSWQAADTLLNRPDADPVLPAPGAVEVIYRARAKGNVSSAGQILSTLRAIGVRIEHTHDDDVIATAELVELSHANPGPAHPKTGIQPTLSLGDAMILAVTSRLGCPAVSRDRYWSWLSTNDLIQIPVATF